MKAKWGPGALLAAMILLCAARSGSAREAVQEDFTGKYWMKGQVVRMDQSSGNLLLMMQPDGITVNLVVAPQALISQGRTLLGVSDIRRGDQVRIGYSTEGDRRVAREIVIQ